MDMKSINTALIEEAASEITDINDQLVGILETSSATVQSLNGVWSGTACDATISAFNAFANKYSQQYRDLLERYSTFLHNTAAGNWSQTETGATSRADLI